MIKDFFLVFLGGKMYDFGLKMLFFILSICIFFVSDAFIVYFYTINEHIDSSALKPIIDFCIKYHILSFYICILSNFIFYKHYNNYKKRTK